MKPTVIVAQSAGLHLAFSLFIPSVLSQLCSFPNGLIIQDFGWQHCSTQPSNPLYTLCCYASDVCLPNGMCKGTFKDTNGQEFIVYGRSLCTERSWSGGLCLDVCLQEKTYAQMTPCDGANSSARWFCSDSDECCTGDNMLAVTLVSAFGEDRVSSTTLFSSSVFVFTSSSSTSSSAISASPSSTTLPSTQPSTSSTSTPSSSTTIFSDPASTSSHANTKTGLSTGAKAGIGVGTAIGALLLAGACFFIVKSLRKGKVEKAEAERRGPTISSQPVQYQDNRRGVSETAEGQGHLQWERSELP